MKINISRLAIRLLTLSFLMINFCFSEVNIPKLNCEYWLKIFEEKGGMDCKYISTPDHLSSDQSIENFKSNILFLIEAIKKNPSKLTYIDFDGDYFMNLIKNQLDVRAFVSEKILESLKFNITVKEIKTTYFPKALSKLLLEILKENNTIEKLRFNCLLSEDEVVELANILNSNTNIKEIDLRQFKTLTLKGKKALREAEDKRNNPGIFSFGKKEPLIILLPNIPDEYLNQNKGRL